MVQGANFQIYFEQIGMLDSNKIEASLQIYEFQGHIFCVELARFFCSSGKVQVVYYPNKNGKVLIKTNFFCLIKILSCEFKNSKSCYKGVQYYLSPECVKKYTRVAYVILCNSVCKVRHNECGE